MLIYEVTVTVDENVRGEFEKFMAESHIPAVLGTGRFEAAFFAGKEGIYRVGYHCESREDLDAYLADHAYRLRSEIAERFPSGIVTERQVLDIIALFPGPAVTA